MEEGTTAHRIFERVGRRNVYEKGVAEGALPAKVVGTLKSLSRGWGRSRHQQTIGGGTDGRVPWIGDEGDEPNIAAAVRALEWKILTHPRHEFCPRNP